MVCHLKFKGIGLPLVIVASWGIAFFEYWLAVPANRWGSAGIWWVISLTAIGRGIGMAALWRAGRWKRKAI